MVIKMVENIKINDIVRCRYLNNSSGRIIDRKDIKSFFNKDYSIVLVELPDGHHEWINEKYVTKVDSQ